MHEQPNIPEEDLRAVFAEQYDLAAASLEFLPLGGDNRAGVYRVVSEQGRLICSKPGREHFTKPVAWFRATSAIRGLQPSLLPFPRRGRRLWTRLGEWTLTVYPFIDGDTGWNPGLTDAQWQAVGTALRQIHQVRLPAEGFAIHAHRNLRSDRVSPFGACPGN